MSEKEKSHLIKLSANSDYQKAIKTLYEKTYDILFSPQIIYLIEKHSKKGRGYEIFNEIIKPNNFALLSERKTIEFIVLKKNEKLQLTDRGNLKFTPIIINQKQYNKLINKLNQENIKIASYHEAYDPNNKNVLTGWIIKHYVTDGYSGNIAMLVGYDINRKIVGFLMVEHEETPGLGTKANDNDFINAFKGKDPNRMPKNKKDFKPLIGIDSISGATITSLAVSKGIQQAYNKLNVYSEEDITALKTKAEEQKKRAEEEKTRAEEQRIRAEEQRIRAEEQRIRAEEQRIRAEEQRIKALKQRKRAQEQRKRAEIRLRKLRKSLD